MLSNPAGALGNIPALAPQAISGSADVNGISIDKRAISGGPFQYGTFAIQHGATTGAPSAVSVAYRVQHSDDNSTYVDAVSAKGANDATVTLTGAAACSKLNVVLAGLKRYVRVVATPTFTSGTSPTLLVAVQLICEEPRYI